jgi:hypothetical protein
MERLAGGPFGHDLDTLLTEAMNNGIADLVNLDARQLAHIRFASTYYQEKVFEYPAVAEALRAYLGNPDANLLLSAAEALVAALREPCLNAN